MELSNKQRRALRQRAHHLKPVVWIGKNGLEDAQLTEASRALDAHELIKVRIEGERDYRAAAAERMVAELGADAVGSIGNILILFRQNEDPEQRKIDLDSPAAGALPTSSRPGERSRARPPRQPLRQAKIRGKKP